MRRTFRRVVLVKIDDRQPTGLLPLPLYVVDAEDEHQPAFVPASAARHDLGAASTTAQIYAHSALMTTRRRSAQQHLTLPYLFQI